MAPFVFVRARPGLVEGEPCASISLTDALAVEVVSESQTWQFDKLSRFFTAEESNEAVYERCVAPLIPRVLEGTVNGLYAYGHTGSGKTHTVIGYEADEGLVFRAVAALTAAAAERGLVLTCRLCEVFDGEVFDLLHADGPLQCTVRADRNNNFSVRAPVVLDEETGQHRVDGLTTVAGEAVEPELRRGLAARQVGDSNVHAQSSRSHALVELELLHADAPAAKEAAMQCKGRCAAAGKRCYDAHEAGDEEGLAEANVAMAEVEAELAALEAAVPPSAGTLVLVDLAGADYAGDSESELSLAFKKINESLLALKECMRAGAGGARAPFRNSKLTMLLKQHLEAPKSRSVMVACVAPEEEHITKNVNTLKYASIVAGIARRRGSGGGVRSTRRPGRGRGPAFGGRGRGAGPTSTEDVVVMAPPAPAASAAGAETTEG